MPDTDDNNQSPSPEPIGLSSTEIYTRKSRSLGRLAVISIIFGILGFLTWGLTSLGGLTLGIVSLDMMRDDWKTHPYRTRVIAGVAVNCVALVFSVFLFMASMHANEEMHHKDVCTSNVKSIGMAMQMYMFEYNNHLPPSHRWVNSLSSYILTSPDRQPPFICPSVEGEQPCYAINNALDGVDANGVADPSKIVMVFESIPGDNPAGGKELLPKPPRHGSNAANRTSVISDARHLRFVKDLYLIALLDGHVERTVAIDRWTWNPEKRKR